MENIKKETQAACLFCRVPVLKEPVSIIFISSVAFLIVMFTIAYPTSVYGAAESTPAEL